MKRDNQADIEAMREAIGDRSVILVGNSIRMISNPPLGEFIDSHDFVVRMGRGYPRLSGFDVEPWTGRKTHCWFFGQLRSSMYEQWLNVRWKVFNIGSSYIYDRNEEQDHWRPSQDAILAQTPEQLRSLKNRTYGTASKNRPSAGMLAVHFFSEVLKLYPSQITLIGFDFFSSQMTFVVDGQEYPAHSWHAPLLIPGKTCPHDGAVEMAYCNSRATLIKQPALDTHALRGIVTNLRNAEIKEIQA